MEKTQYHRKCKICKKPIYYKSKRGLETGKENNASCLSCSAKERIEKYGLPKCSFKKGDCIGEKNPYYGKHHSEEIRKKISKNQDLSFMQTKAYKDKQSKISSGKGNPMYGKTVYGVWLEKYGKEEADKRMVAFKAKQSINSSGKNNPMYGKPSPKGSGNGWSGWYKKVYFRSIRELSYMVYLDKNNIKWKTGETLKIKYVDWDGKERNYLPDFLVGDKVIEIKPKKLKESKIVILKEAAAIKYCKANNLVYKIIDPKPLSTKAIIKLRESGDLKFLDRYEKKFVEKYLKD